MQRPKVEELDSSELGDNCLQFSIGPLEPGFGQTLGNSLRRTLLSSIPGSAVTQIRFDDALHEFGTIDGVVEDVTDIVLNLKDLVFHSESDEPIEIRVDVVGPQQVTGESFATNSEVDVINPDLHIATVNSKANLSFEVTVEKGVGYLSSDRTVGEGAIGVIPVDALFSPVRRVSFEVGNTRVDQSTDYDELILKIETDGSLTPREALASAGKTLGSLVGLVESLAEEEVQGLELTEAESPETNSPDIDLQIEELELSERPRNCLKRAQIDTVGQLLEKSAEDLMTITNFGQKSLDEIYEKQDSWAAGEDINSINSKLTKIARNYDLNDDKISHCLGNENLENQILEGRINGSKKYSIQSTPTIFINEKEYDGEHNYESFRKTIKKFL